MAVAPITVEAKNPETWREPFSPEPVENLSTRAAFPILVATAANVVKGKKFQGCFTTTCATGVAAAVSFENLQSQPLPVRSPSFPSISSRAGSTDGRDAEFDFPGHREILRRRRMGCPALGTRPCYRLRRVLPPGTKVAIARTITTASASLGCRSNLVGVKPDRHATMGAGVLHTNVWLGDAVAANKFHGASMATKFLFGLSDCGESGSAFETFTQKATRKLFSHDASLSSEGSVAVRAA